MFKVTIYTTDFCGLCDAAKAYLDRKGVAYREILVSDPQEKARLKERTGWRTMPQIFVGDELIGGYRDMLELDQRGELDAKLSAL